MRPDIATAPLEGAMSGYYEPAASEDSRPARVVLNSRRFERPPARVSLPGLLLHEAVPGHHLQWSIQKERGSAHPLLRHLSGLSAYSEGWATYAATELAREMGLLASAPERGYQADSDVWRALDFILANGIHAHGWTMEQAIDTFRTYVAAPDDVLREGVMYFIARPGHNLAYPVGAMEIVRLRRRAEATLGNRFDIRRFHDVLLEDGRVPLALLREKVDRWLEESRR